MKYTQWFAKLLKGIGGLSLLGMMLLTCADVAGSVFGYPILGAEELVALWASILLAFALPAAHIEKANVGVDLLYLKLSNRMQRFNDFFITSVSFILFALVSWQCFGYADELRRSGEVTMTLQLPAYMLVYGVSFAFFFLSIVIFFEIITLCTTERSK